jgi:hypothetical protein
MAATSHPHPDVFRLQDEAFINVMKQQCGTTIVKILRYLEVNSADSLLDNDDIFSFVRHDSLDLLPIKNRVGITWHNEDSVVKDSLLCQAGVFIDALNAFRHRRKTDRYPVIRCIIRFFQNLSNQADQSLAAFDHKVSETIMSNHSQAKARFSYSESIRELAPCLFILAGRNAYEFARLNIRGLLPSLTLIQTSLESRVNGIEEGEFRYDLMAE